MHEQLVCELAAYIGCDGLSPSDLLDLPDGLRRIVTWITRRGGASLDDLAGEVGCDAPAAAALAEAMVVRGLISSAAGENYRVRLAGRRSRGGSNRLRDVFHE
jgi:hypothetical protein